MLLPKTISYSSEFLPSALCVRCTGPCESVPLVTSNQIDATAMEVTIVVEGGKTPVYGGFRNPVPSGAARFVTVAASTLGQVACGRAAGTHYRSSGEPSFVPGVDGVGSLEDDRRAYFLSPQAPFGAVVEQTLIQTSNCLRGWTLSKQPCWPIRARRRGRGSKSRRGWSKVKRSSPKGPPALPVVWLCRLPSTWEQNGWWPPATTWRT
jgi:hypothetical protein